MRLLTNLLFEPKGMHNQNAAYSIKDTVMSGDGSRVYFAIQDVPAGIPLNDSNYWKLQIDLSGSKSAMDQALASFADYAKVIGMRVRGEIVKTSGNPVTFLPDAGSLLQPVTVLDVQQAGSGDPSPSNIRPIVGYDALKLVATGKNLLPNNFESFEAGGITATRNADGSIRVFGTSTAENIVTISGDWGNTTENIIGVDDCYVTLSPRFGTKVLRENGTEDWPSSVTIYLAPGDKLLWAYIHFHPGDVWDSVVHPQIELGNQRTSYEPFGKTHTVQIGQTVYGGKFDWLTGKLVAEWEMTALNGNEVVNREENINGSGNARFSISAAVPGIMPMPEANLGMQCSHYYTAFNPIGNNDRNACICGFQGMDAVFIRDDAHSSVEAYKAYLAAQYAAGTPVQIAYKLASPIEIQLAPHIISAADPEQTNTLYGDGRVDVEYVKPLHVSIEERVAAAVAAAMNTEGE